MKQKFVSINEVKKLIKAMQEKYPELLCEGLPYYPEEIEIELFGQVVGEESTFENNFNKTG